MKRSMADYTIAGVPQIETGRSRFNLNSSHTTTFSQGELIPLKAWEVLPGDSFSVDATSLIRMSTPVFPVMDNCRFDIFAFWIPNRLVWDHWKEFIGENTSGPWAPNVQYTIPQLKFDQTIDSGGTIYGAKLGSLSNHLYHVTELPAGSDFTISDLPNRAYRLVYNEFFRSESYQNPYFVPKDDTDRSYSGSYDVDKYGETVFRVNRLPDYFSMVLPAPQNGAPVSIPISGLAPVITGATELNVQGLPGMKMRKVSNNSTAGGDLRLSSAGVDYGSGSAGGSSNLLAPSNLYANLAEVTGNLATINELRTAFQINKLLIAYQNGRRYREILSNVFNVNIPDTTVQVPEYLGGCEFDITINQVVQTSSTDSTSPQGNVSAYSMTVNKSHLFTKSFCEHGVCLLVGCARVRHTYANAINPSWLRKKLTDLYFPQFQNLSDQALFAREFCPLGDNSLDNVVFGYKEAWSEYRTDLNSVSGLFSPDSAGASILSAYTFADYNYNPGTPLVGSPSWLEEPSTNIKQTLAVQSQPDFIANFYFQNDAVRPIPVHSIPGLADHH